MKIYINKELFQWEKDREIYVEISNDDPKITILEFYNSNSKVGEAEVIENGSALIPNYLLRTAKPITVLACIGEKGNTKPVDRQQFRVIPRPRPENYSDDSVAPELPNSPSNGEISLVGYATEKWVQENYQPKGNYLTKIPEDYARKTDLPTKISQLENDEGYLTEHQDISGKLDASKLPEAINTALEQAKASGLFDGKDGKDYILTDTDKVEIAEITAGLVELPNGGNDTLIVEIEGAGVLVASHSSEEIYEYLKNNGNAIALYNGEYYSLIGCNNLTASFVLIDENGDHRYVVISDAKVYTFVTNPKEYVRSVNGIAPDENGNVKIPDTGGNAGFEIDEETLILKNGILSVNTTNNMEQDNTLPITSAGVYATVGNIEALLKTI